MRVVLPLTMVGADMVRTLVTNEVEVTERVGAVTVVTAAVVFVWIARKMEQKAVADGRFWTVSESDEKAYAHAGRRE